MWMSFLRRPSSLNGHIKALDKVRSIAIVGNGPIDPSLSDEIDGCDWVVRFNTALLCGSAGLRTDTLAIINRGRPARSFAKAPELINTDARKQAKEIFFAVDPYRLPPPYSNGYTDGKKDYTKKIARQFESNKPYYFIPTDFHIRLIAELMKHGAKDGVLPSTGVLVINLLHELHQNKELRLFGFSHQGWEGHCWAAESGWISSLSRVVLL